MTSNLSPTGKRVVESSGPLTANLVFLGESPVEQEVAEGVPFVGRAGKILNAALRTAGIDRTQIRLMNLVPVRAPQDNYSNHDSQDLEFGLSRCRAELATLRSARVIVALGANPTEWLLGGRPPVVQRGERRKESFINEWRGSALPLSAFKLGFEDSDRVLSTRPEDYLDRLGLNPPSVLQASTVVVPTFHPAAVLRQFTWHPWFLMDIQRAAKIAAEGLPPVTYRKWYIQDVEALKRLAASGVDLISFDSELDPWIVGIATEDEVHVFEWSEAFRAPLTALLTSPRILKVAHNWTHDYAFARKCLEITVARPYFDTQGGAHELNNALQKELSPHIATRFTNWPYHKWLSNVDQLIYCGMDAVTCYDAYWPMIGQLAKRGLYVPASVGTVRPLPSVSEFDHKLLTPLMEMQAVGFKIDESTRQDVEAELKQQLDAEAVVLQKMVEPIVELEISHFEKPHLFRVDRKCDCCGGGKTQRDHCENCGGLSGLTKDEAVAHGFKTIKALKASLPPCVKCRGTGKIVKKLDFNPDSPDQLADVIYRGLHIRPRTFKGNETTKAAQLDPLRDRHPVIARLVDVSKLRADYDTVARLRAGSDGLLHCVFDPFGTSSGRVAGKEGLLENGTNPMNLPVAARRFVVPRDGFVFLYPDMSQIEARAVAVLSGDKNLIAAFTTPLEWLGHPKHGKIDSHTFVVQMMHNVGGVMITRQQAKRLVYAAMYGARAAQLAVELNAEAYRLGDKLRLTTKQVQLMLDTFFKVFSGVRDWQKRVKAEVLETRRLRCPFTGRERTWLGYIVETRKRNPDYGDLKYEIAKQVWSFLPQWLGAYVLGLGLIDMYYNTDEWGHLLQPLVHVHDALLIEAPKDRVEEASKLALKLLTRDLFGITFPAEMKVGKNWLEASGG